MPSILSEKMNRVITLTLNRPKVINALDQALFENLLELLKLVNSGTKAVIIRGAGEKGFCAGADLKLLAGMDGETLSNYLTVANSALNSLAALPCPTIALVHGFTLGGGLELALACDFILADEKTTLGMPETKIGLIPGFGGAKRLANRIGIPKAKELIFTSKKITTEEALSMKLIDMSIKGEFLNEMAAQFIETLSPELSLAKQAFAQDDTDALFKEAFKKMDWSLVKK